MTTSDPKVLHSRGDAYERAVRGVHTHLIVVEVPAGAEAMIGKPLVEQTLTINGDYVCLIPCTGLATELNVHVKPQTTVKTSTSSGPDELEYFDPRVTDVADAEVLTSGTGDGLQADDTEQIATLPLTGAIYARYTIAAAGGAGSITFDRAEYVGL